jgi:diaminopimelate decarboxylase
MADIALVTANKVEIVESIEQMTLPTDEAVTAGMAVRINTTTGKFTKANGSAAGEARIYGIATKTVASGMPLTAVRQGVMDGWDLSGLAYDAVVYLSDTDGRLGDAAGTVSTVVGRVIPGTAETLGTAFSKLLLVDL